MFKKILASVCLTCLLSAATVVQAQVAETGGSSEQSFGLEEIIVTARKRAESLQDIYFH